MVAKYNGMKNQNVIQTRKWKKKPILIFDTEDYSGPL